MTDDAAYAAALEEIRVMRARLKRIEDAAAVVEAPKVWTTAEIGNRDTWRDHKNEIMAAQRENRIVEAEPAERPAPVAVIDPETGWQVVGQDQYLAPEPAPKSKGQKP